MPLNWENFCDILLDLTCLMGVRGCKTWARVGSSIGDITRKRERSVVGGKCDATMGAIRQCVTPASHGEGSDEPTSAGCSSRDAQRNYEIQQGAMGGVFWWNANK